METIQIEILNPKVKKLLKNLAALNLIKIKRVKNKSDFSSLIQELRAKSTDEIPLDEIPNEVEQVRNLRYMK